MNVECEMYAEHTFSKYVFNTQCTGHCAKYLRDAETYKTVPDFKNLVTW